MVTALCNVFINSPEKLDLFKDSFSLVYKISDNWLIYIRGGYRKQVVAYIKKEFADYKKNVIFFDNLFENNWAKSTSQILEKSKYDYIYVFLEDHFLLRSIKHFKQVINSMEKNDIDYFQYSFFNIGLPVYSIEHLYPDSVDYFYTITLNSNQVPKLQKSNKSFYPYSLAGVLSKRYFNQLLNIEKKYLVKVPFLVQALMENTGFLYPKNRTFWFRINQLVKKIGLRFVIYLPSTPFNLEKSLFDCDKELLPLKVGVLREELFANWDEDSKLSGSSLIKRGLYPKYFRVNNQKKPKLADCKITALRKGYSSSHQYFPDTGRVLKLPMKYIYVKKGSLKISSKRESFILNTGRSAWIVASIPHSFFARKDCTFYLYIDSGL